LLAELSVLDVAGTADVYRFTVDDFERMEAAGILHEDDRIELIDGVMVAMSPISLLHVLVVSYLMSRFDDARHDRYMPLAHSPVLLSDRSAPQPDLYLALLPRSRYRSRLPGPADVLLLVEVADSSLGYDRTVKRRLYAFSGISEYWIVDLAHGRLFVHRSPRGDGYAEITEHSAGETVSPAFFPELVLSVDEVLNPGEG
jgi:Uma2 family endonuclease